MKDIDFDELDRAVSSVLNKDTASASTAPADDDTTSSTVGETISVTSKSPEPSPKGTSSDSSRPTSAVPARRGRFMDLVRTDMSVASQPLTKHEAPTLKPTPVTTLAAVETAPVVESKTTLPVANDVEHVSEPTAELDEAGALLGAEPAPIQAVPAETASPPPSDDAKPSQNVQVAAGDKVGDVEPEVSDELEPTQTSLATTVPQTSPFLADTKVEKRPLGATADAAVGKDDESADAPARETVVSDVPLPRELEADVRDVEITQSEQEQAIASGGPFAAGVPVAAEPADDGRVEGHPLFDTTTYHEPIIDVSHKGLPGWLKWTLGLAACLIVGAGVGYFLFTAGL